MEQKTQLKQELKPSLLLRLGPYIDLLTKPAQDLLESHNIALTVKTKPPWFYRGELLPKEPVYTPEEITRVEEQIRYEFDGIELEIAQEIVSCLDHRGYFTGRVEEIAQHYGVEPQKVERVRVFITKNIEPLGTACKNLEEFIRLQVEELYPGQKDLLQEVLLVLRGKSKDKKALEVLSRLRLTPFEGRVEYTGGVVDMVFEHDGQEWYVFLFDEFLQASSEDPRLAFVLELRRRLLRSLAQLIIERQEDFLLGKGPLKAMSLSHVAERLGVSLSTLSRLVSSKYAKTPTGTHPIRLFFQREGKQGLSKEEILKAIKEVLQEKGKDLSDRQVSELLKQKGIHIARRTVNKYRKML